MIFKKTLKILLKSFLIITGLILIYFIAALVLSHITSNSDFTQCDKDAVEVYILTNGVHTDIVLPIKNDFKNWGDFVKPEHTKSAENDVNYVAFGWGDKGFYLETPTWAELKFKTAFNAMFFLSTTAMHVTFYENLNENESCKKICISMDSYAKLVNYISNSFALQKNMPILIPGASYSSTDAFYDALGTYSLFCTCNTWANKALKEAGLKACYWTPFDMGIFNKYK